MPTQTKSDRKAIALLMLLLTAVLWSLSGLLIKSVNWNPLAIVGSRSIISAIFIYPFFKSKIKLRFSKYILIGAMAYSGTVITFVAATKLTTAANAILLQYTAPIYVAAFSYWLLKEKIVKTEWLVILFIFSGMCLFFLDDLTSGNMLGNILAIISGIFFALLAICLRKQKNASPIESVFWGNILTGLIGFPFMIGSSPDPDDWTILILLGVVQLAIPYILFSYAIKHVSALEAITIPIIEPILNPIWVFIFLAETPGKWAIIGGSIVLSTILVHGYIIYRKSINGIKTT